MDYGAIFGKDMLLPSQVRIEARRRGIRPEELIRQFIEEGLERARRERRARTDREPQRAQAQQSVFRDRIVEMIWGKKAAEAIEKGIQKFRGM